MASMIPYGVYDRALRRSFPFDMIDDLLASPIQTAVADAAFKMDVEDTGESYVVSAELPGVKRDEIDVELNEGRLSISVEKKETEEEKAHKAKVMEACLHEACSVPMEIMVKCCEAIELQKEFAAKGSSLAISDAGVGVAFCKAALQGASLNVFINTKSMKEREYADGLNKKALEMLDKYVPMADEIYESVFARLRPAE